jgi:hypothetical protein
MELEDYLLRLLDESREEIRLSDTKASIMLGASAAVSAFLAGSLADDASQFRTDGSAVAVLSFVVLGTFLAAMVMLGLAVLPRLGHAEPGRARYFEEQAQFETPAKLLEALVRESADPPARHSQQLLTLARISRRKFHHLRRAMFTLSGGLFLLGLTCLVSAIN